MHIELLELNNFANFLKFLREKCQKGSKQPIYFSQVSNPVSIMSSTWYRYHTTDRRSFRVDLLSQAKCPIELINILAIFAVKQDNVPIGTAFFS